MRRALTLSLFLAATLASAQEMLTADQFFAKVSAAYASVEDYEAQIAISNAGQPMRGVLYFKSPAFLRINFSQPADQVIVFDGTTLKVYIPQYRAVLQQETGSAGLGAGAAALASREGLSMMKRNYTIAWESSPQASPLDQGSSEMVHKLMLTRKSVSEGFKTIRVSVSASNLLIRRIEGWTVSNERIAFDFTSITLNQGIPAARFLYDAPASANIYNNFLFQ
ncbi:MAG TPA: outer membrane lipoprotein carrier protein LolA [Rectinemataceae bacterium]